MRWLVCILALLSVATAHAQLEKPDVHIAVGGKASLYYLPLTIAEQLGYFKNEGLNVKISDFAGGAVALRAVVGGSADVVSGAYEHTVSLQGKKQFFQAFAAQGRLPQIAFGVVSAKAGRVKSFKDLKGFKVGVSAPGSSTHNLVKQLLTKGGLDANKDVSVVGVGLGAQAIAAIKSGQIDAISNTDPIMTKLEQEGAIKVIADTRTLKGTQDVFGGPMPAGCLYAPLDYVQKHPNTCQALANAVVRGLKWLQTAGPSDIIKTVPESYLLGDRALYLAAWDKVKEAISPDGMMPDDGPKTALKALASFEPSVKPDRINLAKTYTNEFARRAKEKFKA